MKPTSLIPLLAGILYLFAGCSDNETFNSRQEPTADHIRFSTRLPATRAAAYEETGMNAYTTMGVYATIDNTSNLMANQQVTRTDGSNGWSYTPLARWPANSSTVSFYAYAPYGAVTSVQPTVDSMPRINNFTVAATTGGAASAQVDLLLAEALVGKCDSLTADVNFTMRHALTRMLFSARTQHPYATGVTSIQISQIELTGLKNEGTHLMDALDFWTGQAIGAASNAYTLTTAGGGLAATDLSNTALSPISTNNGNLYLLPQMLTDPSAQLKITTITTGGSSAGSKTYTFALINLLDELKQGEALRFLLTVPNTANPEAFQIEVQHDDWNEEFSTDTDIELDPVLYVSNETVYAYDGAVTCVYFSSNIPPHPDNHPTDPDGFNDIVYIEDQGRISSNIGTTFSVKDEFYAIAQHDPDRRNMTVGYAQPHVNNLRYEKQGNFYKGHLDIVQRKTTAAGETSNQGKLPLILKLHVGKLVRDITVQRVVTTEAAKQNPTRYVGTFHRHHETGERLVTWFEAETTVWRVEKDLSIGTSDDQQALQLDTRISPDFRNKQLYSLVARDPEGTRVEQNDNLFGRGRVYFRVGWKSPTNGVDNRYARVKVSLWHIGTPLNGNPSEVHYLYCRQGETPAQIATAPSQYALFNVNMPGEFARYPSQTGMLYQWNRLIPWSPLGEAAPYGWNAAPTDYEANFSYERSACPEGYVYPSTMQFNEMKAVFGPGGTAQERGYYADGYFDRRAITYNSANPSKDEHRVNASNIEVGGIGTLLFNGNAFDPNGRAARSIFLVSGGYRNGVQDPLFGASGQLIANEDHGADHGVHGGYWFDIQGANASEAAGASIFKGTDASFIKDYSKRNAHSLRCILATGWLLLFDTNGGENGPRNMTVPSDQTIITLPATVPNNYYRTGYLFRGWTTVRNGSGTVYTSGQAVPSVGTFGAAENPAHQVNLYAKWGIVIDFRTPGYGIPVGYLYDISTNTSDPYAGLTSLANGTAYAAADSEAKALDYLSGLNKAYPILEFSEMKSAVNLITAYQACKDMLPANTWRLPRVQEVVLVQKYTNAADQLLGAKNAGIWTGTSSTVSGEFLCNYREHAGRYSFSTSAGTARPYRCVRPAL